MMAMVASPLTAQTVIKIGYVDYQRILKEWASAKTRLNELETKFDSENARLDGLEEELKKKKQEVDDKISLAGSEEQKKKMIEEYQVAVKSYLDTYKQSKERMDQEKEKVLESIYSELKTKIQAIAEKNGYSLILRKQDLVYAGDKYDITDEVISTLK